jgi:hypothetical protein
MGFLLLEGNKMIVSGYSMDLYCEYENDSIARHVMLHPSSSTILMVNGKKIPFSFAGHSFAECATQARKAGWKLSKKHNRAVCPICAQLKRRVMPETVAEQN